VRRAWHRARRMKVLAPGNRGFEGQDKGTGVVARPRPIPLAQRKTIMNVFEEFRRLVSELEKQRVRYALVGGVAMAFYAEPRFTRDIDLLLDPDDFQKVKGILEKNGYFESAAPWTFQNVDIELHRFLKVVHEEDEMLIDILVAKDEEARKIIQNAVEAESEEGKVMLANKKDLIWLKRTRDSKQDQVDIEKLEDDED
jgi:hypothetical protein